VCREVEQFRPAPGSIIFSSYSIAALEICKALLPTVPRSLLVGAIPDDWESVVSRLDCFSLNFYHDAATKEQVGAVARRVPAVVYTVNDPSRAAELFSWGVAAVITDCPHTILAHLPADAACAPSAASSAHPAAAAAAAAAT